MPISNLRLTTSFIGLLLAFAASAQLDILEFPKEKQTLSIEARVGYYWDLGSLPDSIQSPVKEYYEKLMKGPRFDFALLYNWNDNFDIGFNYSYFTASSEIDKISLIYTYGNGQQQQFSGRLKGEVRQQYFALRLDPSFKLGDYFYLKPGISSGVLTYFNSTSIDSLRETISGATLAFQLHLGLAYYFDNNWSLNLTGSYLTAFLHEPDIRNNLEPQPSENLSASLFKWYVGFGIRYSFTKKGTIAPRPTGKELPQDSDRKRRFD